MDDLKIVIVDDDPGRVTDMAENVRAALSRDIDCEVEHRSDEGLKEDMAGLLDRKDAFENGGVAEYAHVFDGADILVIDYDLSQLYEAAYMTGEDVAQLARLYTRAGPIVSVNRFGPPVFDLRLRDTLDSWADYSVAHEDLSLEGLWLEDWGHEFRPWYWPVMTHMPELFDKRINSVYRNREHSITELLGFRDVALKVMPDKLYDQLVDPAALTFVELARDHVVPPKAPELPDRQLVRIGVSEVSSWLADSVLPRQDVLIDAPHLVGMFPSLLPERNTGSLASVCAIDPDAKLPIENERVAKDRFRKGYWLDRPVWWTEDVLESNAIQENVEPWTKENVAVVFGEDGSTFYQRQSCTQFRCEGLIKRRYVRMSDSMKRHASYKPQSRLIG